MVVQRPLQHVSPIVQVSPSTRQAGSNWHAGMAPSGAPQERPQQSSFFAHGSPAGRQAGIPGAHMPAIQLPPQQSGAASQGAPAGAQLTPPQTPPVQASAQQTPAAAQPCPSETQPVGLAQTSAPEPAGSSAQTNEQQSAPALHAAPSAPHVARAQRPSTQAPEQQSVAVAQRLSLARQRAVGSARGIVSSTSRRQPTARRTIKMGTLRGFPNPPAMLRGEQSAPAPHAIKMEP